MRKTTDDALPLPPPGSRRRWVDPFLGIAPWSTFFRTTLPLAWRSMLVGLIMYMARAVSEFGAVVIVAYHPMVAPVMI